MLSEDQEINLLQNQMPFITIYSDGGFRNELGYGGYGTIMTDGIQSMFLYGGYPNVTNNTMELEAALSALRQLTTPCRVNIVSDSRYLCDGINSWVLKWANNNWRNSTNKVISNYQQWKEMFQFMQYHIIRATWTKGHAGDAANQICDHLATIGMFKTAGQQVPPHLIDPKRK